MTKTMQWIEVADYPVTDYLVRAPIIFGQNAFYVFGGSNSGTSSSIIQRLDAIDLSWSEAGRLTKARRGHNVIFYGADIFVVGGSTVYDDSSFTTEKCTIANTKITCTEQLPTIEYYEDWPELFLVPELFCKN